MSFFAKKKHQESLSKKSSTGMLKRDWKEVNLMAKGWVVIYRSIMDNPLWEDKPFSRGQAWIDMILLASHKDTEFYFDGDMVSIEKGQIITSKRKLGDRWGRSNLSSSPFTQYLALISLPNRIASSRSNLYISIFYFPFHFRILFVAHIPQINSFSLLKRRRNRRHRLFIVYIVIIVIIVYIVECVFL